MSFLHTNFMIGKIATELLLQVGIIVISEKTNLIVRDMYWTNPSVTFLLFILHSISYTSKSTDNHAELLTLGLNDSHSITTQRYFWIRLIVTLKYTYTVNFAHRLMCTQHFGTLLYMYQASVINHFVLNVVQTTFTIEVVCIFVQNKIHKAMFTFLYKNSLFKLQPGFIRSHYNSDLFVVGDVNLRWVCWWRWFKENNSFTLFAYAWLVMSVFFVHSFLVWLYFFLRERMFCEL